MSAILEFQHDYFVSGDEIDLKPMILMDIAEIIQMDISTISRVSNSKYVETSFGTFLLKELFSEAYKKEDGTEISTKEIKLKLQKIIESEDKRKPFTDEKLSKLIGENEYHIATYSSFFSCWFAYDEYHFPLSVAVLIISLIPLEKKYIFFMSKNIYMSVNDR